MAGSKPYRVYPQVWLEIEAAADWYINHTVKYADGRVHTNTLENFWSLLNAASPGPDVSIEPFHLFRYLDEQAFRFTNRKDSTGEKLSDPERFNLALFTDRRKTFDLRGGDRKNWCDAFLVQDNCLRL